MLLFSCDSGFYGDFEIDLNEYENGVVFKGAGSLKEIRTEILYIPETMYGFPVVEIGKSSGEIFSKKVVVPKSVEKIGEYSFNSNYKTLETLVILSDKLNTIECTSWKDSWTGTLSTIILCATTPPTIHSGYFNNGRMFYVPDESLYSYQTAYPRNVSSFLPISEYDGDLSYSNINKPNWDYKIDSGSPSWYYYDVRSENGIDIMLANGVFHSEIYRVSESKKNLYFNFIYNPNTIICDLEISSKDDKPIVLPEPSYYYTSRIYVYSETPVKIMYSGRDYPGHEMKKIN